MLKKDREGEEKIKCVSKDTEGSGDVQPLVGRKEGRTM